MNAWPEDCSATPLLTTSKLETGASQMRSISQFLPLAALGAGRLTRILAATPESVSCQMVATSGQLPWYDDLGNSSCFLRPTFKFIVLNVTLFRIFCLLYLLPIIKNNEICRCRDRTCRRSMETRCDTSTLNLLMNMT